MIVVDSSALIAILTDEPERLMFLGRLARADDVALSAVTRLETGIVIARRSREAGLVALARLLAELDARFVPFDETQAVSAIAAYQIFGKGFYSKAKLNFGDCASYALAKALDAPLLYKGDDFSQTDIISAL